MSKTAMRITLLGVIFCFLFSGCNTQDKIGSMLTATPEPTTTATPTPTFAPTSTSTPTATPTPISIESAVKQGSLTEIETIGKGYIRKSIYSPDGSYLVIVVTRGLYIFNSDTMEEKKFFPLTPGTSIESVVFSDDGKIFAAGDSNSDVTFWNTQTWEITQILQLNNGPIISIDFSPDGYYMATVGGTYETSYKLSLWNLTDGLLINAYYRGKSCKRVDFSSDGTRIFLSEGRDITVWYVKDLQLYDRIDGLGSYTIMPNHNIFANNRYVYNFDKNERLDLEIPLSTFETIENEIFIDDNNLIIKREFSDQYYLFNLETHRLTEISFEMLVKLNGKNPEIGIITNKDKFESLGFINYPSILDITQNGRYLIMSEGVMEIENKQMTDYVMYDLWNGSTYQKLDDGNLAVVKIESKRAKKGKITITIFSQEDFFVLEENYIDYHDLGESIDQAKLSPDGKLLAIGLENGTLCLWDLESNEITSTVKYAQSSGTEFGQKFSFSSINFTDDSSQVITVGTLDKTKNTWSTVDLTKISSETKLGILSPDGTLFAYKYSDSVVLVEYLNEKKQSIMIDNNSQKINSLKFSNDSTMLIISDQDGLKIWSLEDQSLLLEIPRYRTAIFSPDGSRIYTQSDDSVIGIWGNNN